MGLFFLSEEEGENEGFQGYLVVPSFHLLMPFIIK